MDLEKISNILSNPSWDIIVLFFFVSVGFFYGISAGKNRFVSLLFSLYVAGFLFENFFYLDKFIGKGNIFEVFLARVFVFLIMVFLLNILFFKVFRLNTESGERKWWQIFLISLFSSGLFFSYIFHLFPSKEIFTFSPVVQNLFVSDAAFFWWLTLPLVALFLIRK